MSCGHAVEWIRALSSCGERLTFNKSGSHNLKLTQRQACRHRLCAICNYYLGVRSAIKFHQHLRKITTDNPDARWVMLTLTIPNVPIKKLSRELKAMSRAWHRLMQRKVFRRVIGWSRSTEVTCEQLRPGYAHPHFHS